MAIKYTFLRPNSMKGYLLKKDQVEADAAFSEDYVLKTHLDKGAPPESRWFATLSQRRGHGAWSAYGAKQGEAVELVHRLAGIKR